MGAVLLDPTMRKCLLVRGFSQQASWGFPRGKVAKGESDASCAIREVRLQTLCGRYTYLLYYTYGRMLCCVSVLLQ